MEGITLQKIRRLDKVSLSVIEKIIEDYDDYRMEVNRMLHKAGGVYDEKSYEIVASQLKYTLSDEIKTGILEQLYNENIGGKNND